MPKHKYKILLLAVSLIALGACESNTAKQWQNVFNDQSGKYGRKAGR